MCIRIKVIIRITTFTPATLIQNLKAHGLSVFNNNLFYWTSGMDANAQTLHQGFHRLDNLVHAPFRMPGAQTEIGKIHEIVKSRGLAWFGAQKKYGKFQSRNQFGVFELFAHLAANGFEKLVHPKRGFGRYQFQGRQSGPKHHFIDGDIIVFARFLDQFAQLHRATRLDTFEFRTDLVHRIAYGDDLVREEYFVSGVQFIELVIVGNLFPEIAKKLFEDIGHPVPARAHIKGKSLALQLTCPTPDRPVFFIDGNLVSRLGQIGRGRKRCEPRTNNRDFFRHKDSIPKITSFL